jgi:prepilin-type N-terminal cleavage/methylation domain-containing protein
MNTKREMHPESLKKRMIHRLRLGMESQRGFTLIELLVVIIIIAILSAIAIPTFLGQREHAQDAAAYSLVRNSLTAVQGAFVDTSDYTKLTAAGLHAIEPSIDFIAGADSIVATAPAGISNGITANARDNQVEFYADSSHSIDLATKSDSGNMFGVQVDSLNIANTGYVKVKVVEGSAGLGW